MKINSHITSNRAPSVQREGTKMGKQSLLLEFIKDTIMFHFIFESPAEKLCHYYFSQFSRLCTHVIQPLNMFICYRIRNTGLSILWRIFLRACFKISKAKPFLQPFCSHKCMHAQESMTIISRILTMYHSTKCFCKLFHLVLTIVF